MWNSIIRLRSLLVSLAALTLFITSVLSYLDIKYSNNSKVFLTLFIIVTSLVITATATVRMKANLPWWQRNRNCMKIASILVGILLMFGMFLTVDFIQETIRFVLLSFVSTYLVIVGIEIHLAHKENREENLE
jgi:hypothetical protein